MPAGVNMVRSMWLFKHKFHVDKTFSRYKARLVANDSSQQLGVDFDETFSLNYALQLLERSHMVTCKPSQKPVDTESKLGPEGVPIQDPTLYRSLVGGSRDCDFGLQLYVSATTSLVGYTDADWAACPSTRSLLHELHSPLSTETLVYCDNVSAVYMYANPVQHQWTKHIEIDIHFVCDMVTGGHVTVLHIPSHYQYADIFTKGLPLALFEYFWSRLSVCPPTAPTTGAY
ncbi:ribonuclease H-like domain-containing protein [Tanacetum coccineum]